MIIIDTSDSIVRGQGIMMWRIIYVNLIIVIIGY